MNKRVKKTKEETSKDIWMAVDLIKRGLANKLEDPKSKVISIKNVCLQANISRPTLYSYPIIKSYIDENSTKKRSEENKDILLKKLTIENKELKDYIKVLEKQRDDALMEQFNSNEKLKGKIVKLK